MSPLSPTVYLFRNAGKTVPLIGVIMLAVLLVASIVSLINSIPYSIRTIYQYSQEMTGVGPRGDTTLTPKLIAEIKEQSPVPIERTMICRASSAVVQSIVGKWPFVVLGLSQDDMKYYLSRMNGSRIIGRLPTPGAAEAIISAPVAKNLDRVLYDPHASKAEREKGILLAPGNTDSWSVKEVKIVGIAQTDKWLMLDTIEYQRENHFPPVDLGLVFAKNLQDQDKLDHWADIHFKGRQAQIFAYFKVEKDTRTMFKTLYMILNVVIGTLVLVITFMMGMLMNIYQSQRLVEFGLLQAIGYTRNQLLRRVVFESLIFVLAGWFVGVGAAYGLLNLAKAVIMTPRAFQLDCLDPVAYSYTVPLPFAILIVALATVVIRFRKFDPVSIVERRLV